jgi:hypothetical protein
MRTWFTSNISEFDMYATLRRSLELPSHFNCRAEKQGTWNLDTCHAPSSNITRRLVHVRPTDSPSLFSTKLVRFSTSRTPVFKRYKIERSRKQQKRLYIGNILTLYTYIAHTMAPKPHLLSSSSEKHSATQASSYETISVARRHLRRIRRLRNRDLHRLREERDRLRGVRRVPALQQGLLAIKQNKDPASSAAVIAQHTVISESVTRNRNPTTDAVHHGTYVDARGKGGKRKRRDRGETERTRMGRRRRICRTRSSRSCSTPPGGHLCAQTAFRESSEGVRGAKRKRKEAYIRIRQRRRRASRSLITWRKG